MPSFSRLPFVLLALLAGCSTAPVLTIPDPLPEALEWTRPTPREEGGSFLGLKTRENDSGSLDALFFEPGVRVVRVIENSPAAQAGIQVGDIVLEWESKPVNDPGALEGLVRATAPGTEVHLQVQRDDTVFDVKLNLRSSTPGTASEVEVSYYRDTARSIAGWADAKGGARLVASHDEAPFPRAGVPVGSLVTDLDGREVLSARDLIRRMQALPPGTPVEVRFEGARGQVDEVEVELQDEETVVTGLQVPILFNYTADLERDTREFVLIDLYVISLFRYSRDGNERAYKFLRWIQFSSGSGDLSE